MSAPRSSTPGGSKRSPSIARYLTIGWERARALVEEGGSYGERERTMEEVIGLQRPIDGGAPKIILLYVHDGALKREEAEKIEKELFKDDDIAILSKIIRFVKLDGTQLPESLREEYAPALPTVHVFDGLGEKLYTLPQPRTKRHVEVALNRVFKAQYRISLTRWMKDMEKCLREIEQREDQTYALTDSLKKIKERAAKRMTASKKRQIKKAEDELKELREEISRIEKMRDEQLLNPPLSRSFEKRVAAAEAAEESH